MVQVGDKEVLETRTQEIMQAGRGVWRRKSRDREVGGGPAGGALTVANRAEAPPRVSWAPRRRTMEAKGG